ncbi:MAG: four helix bundle protein [Verrucomicrobiota bacterium]
MALIRSFRDMKVYQRSRAEAQRIFKLSQSFPREERFSFTDQIRRSSRAVKSMIAEAWAHRRYPASFVSKLTNALGEATETQSWLDDALDCGYVTPAQHHDHDAAWQSVGGMINNTIERADDFCRSAAK